MTTHSDEDRHVIGLIADTHGLLRPEVHQALSGVGSIQVIGEVGHIEAAKVTDVLANGVGSIDLQAR